MRLSNAIIFLLLSFSFNSCSDNNISIINSKTIDEKIIFEVEYTNWAWGYQHFGYFIDTTGDVHSYDLGTSNITLYDTSFDYYSEEYLRAKFNHADTLRRTVNHDSLRWSYTLARLVLPGPYSDRTNIGADMGSISYYVYLYDPVVTKYHKILLSQEGDWTFYNTQESAMVLVPWLKRVTGLYF